YIVLEYLVGETLEDMIAGFTNRGELIPVGTVVAIARQVAAGLHRAHSKAIVHRDIKPSNIFVCYSEAASIVKLIDFGLALIQRETMVEQAQPMLSPPYAPPEQWQRWETVDEGADIYAFGATLYEMLTGTAPFGYAGDLHAAHASAPVPSIVERRKQHRNVPPVPAVLISLVERMLAKRPAERPPLVQIRQVLETTAMTEPAASANNLRARRSRLPWILIAAGGAALVGVGVIAAMQSHPPEKSTVVAASVQEDASVPTHVAETVPPPPLPAIDAAPPDAREDVAADGARFRAGDRVFHKISSTRFVHGRLELLASDHAVVDGSETKLDDLSPVEASAALNVGAVVLMPAVDGTASFLGKITALDHDTVALRYLDGKTLKSVSFSATADNNGRLSRPVKVRESWQAPLAPLLDPPPVVPHKQSSTQGCLDYCENVAKQQPGTDGFTRCMSGCN
ncbi:MAG TPA: serine/threonine-protein kinase, partial [Kofleriaceae bacterium]